MDLPALFVVRHDRNHDRERVLSAVVLDQRPRLVYGESGIDEVRAEFIEEVRKLGDLGVPVTHDPASVATTGHGRPFKTEIIRTHAVQPKAGEVSDRITVIENAVHVLAPKCRHGTLQVIERRGGTRRAPDGLDPSNLESALLDHCRRRHTPIVGTWWFVWMMRALRTVAVAEEYGSVAASYGSSMLYPRRRCSLESCMRPCNGTSATRSTSLSPKHFGILL